MISFVFYLQRDGNIPTSPFVLEIAGIGEILRFNYHPIEVYNMSSEDLRQIGLPGLLPLLPLTRDGACQRVVEEMIEEVEQIEDEAERKDLLAASLNFASLAFGKEGDQEWLFRRFHMLDEVLSQTPLSKHIQQIGRDAERQEEMKRHRQALATIVQGRFPALAELAEKQAASIDKPEAINLLVINISLAKDTEEAKKYLVQAGKRRRKKTT